ncbi:hypothetical protein JST56_04650 [Candidatus Dependentiae bacterium]|nr:hypothetical protein [Candidatus Dependentiae bacterium]
MLRVAKSVCTVILASFCFLLIGCAKYTPRPLQSVLSKAKEQNDVRVSAALLTEQDCRYYFSRRVLEKGYQPIQLYIQNNSTSSYVFDAARLNIQVKDRDVVVKALQLNTAKRVAQYAIPGIFMGIFLIPAIVEGVKSSQVNKELDRDFAKRVISSNSRIVIAPDSTFNKVMFVRADDMHHELNVELACRKTKEKLNFALHI